jgi:hypothetical protein
MSLDRADEYARGRFFAWQAKHPHLAEDPSQVWAAAWQAGAWDAIQRNATLGLNLSQVIQRLEELARMYADVDMDDKLDRELAQASAYWKTDA